MKPYEIIHGDCLTEMSKMPANSVDSIVTDPPYEIGFMSAKWDNTGIANNVEMWREALRVLKPGGHLLAFSGSRTYHRMVCAIEDAGFEVRDQIMWVYGSGFPKSHNLSGDWEGWGTALKPAHEPICVARKPLIGTVTANVLAHGTGALNIDGCRVGTDTVSTHSRGKNAAFPKRPGENTVEESGRTVDQRDKLDHSERIGRWPANLIHDGSDEVLAVFPDAKGQQGDLKETGRPRPSPGRFGDMAPPLSHAARVESETSAARFFYCAKTSKVDREDGNTHPTVKPTDLMAYLVRLVTPPGGLVLDPFMGSGSTGKACMREDFRFIGIELDAGYLEIAESRIDAELAVPKQASLL